MEKKDANLKDASLIENIILFLIISVGAIIFYNQLQFAKISSNILFNSISFLLIIVLIALVVWLFLDKKRKKEKKEIKYHKEHDVEDSAEIITESIKQTVKNHKKPLTKPFTFQEKLNWSFIVLISILVFFNQFQISQAKGFANGKLLKTESIFSKVSVSGVSGNSVSGKSGVVIGPQLNPDGRTTKLVEWKTISETPATKSTGNPTQDAIATVVPIGTPFYALEGDAAQKIKGVSFDDPLTSQKVWASLLGSRRFGTENAIQLNPEEEKRWQKLTSVFTCDFCCGGPNSVTTINRCGCAHSYAWQGMTKFFIKFYPSYSDEQILGEMTKWKALWYPKGMIQDYLVYTGQQPATSLTHGGSIGIKQQFLQSQGNQQQTHTTATPLDQLPSMVGGC